MLNEAERRVKLVSEMNGTMANIQTAKERDAKANTRLIAAQEALAEIQSEHEARDIELRGTYRIHHQALGKATEPSARVDLINAINETLEDIERNKRSLAKASKEAVHELNNSKSEKGCAAAELRKLEELLEEQHARLNKLLPAPEALEPAVPPAQSANATKAEGSAWPGRGIQTDPDAALGVGGQQGERARNGLWRVRPLRVRLYHAGSPQARLQVFHRGHRPGGHRVRARPRLLRQVRPLYVRRGGGGRGLGERDTPGAVALALGSDAPRRRRHGHRVENHEGLVGTWCHLAAFTWVGPVLVPAGTRCHA
ncbi:MAG: hypothetical protein AB7W59_00280 [Acidimicrobiia bacterium]